MGPSLKHIREILSSGVEKIVEFAHRVKVIVQLKEGLSDYEVLTLNGQDKKEGVINMLLGA